MKITDIMHNIRLSGVARKIASAVMIALALPSMAMTLEQARQAFNRGDYYDAVDVLISAANGEPKNQQLNQMAGLALMYTGQPSKAVSYLKRGSNESNLYLAQIALENYDIPGAESYLEAYDTGLGKGKRKKSPLPLMGEIETRIENISGMLDRVAAIEIIDSIHVNRDDFFRHYLLTKSSGHLAGEEELPKNVAAADMPVVYVTENGRTKIWAAPDEKENYVLVRSTMLDDGSWETPHPLGDILNDGGDANFPFLMSDGVSLYFANDGDNTLGGYDIFIASDNGDEFLQPQNIGMPFNSPYDDYMLAIDEENGIGWWATDRNQLGDDITIYRFIPQDYRKNYPVDTPNLARLAMAADIDATHQPGKDYASIINSLKTITANANDDVREFDFALPGGKIYHRLADFRSERARRAMADYLNAREDIDRLSTRLADMRQAWKRGNHSQAQTIKALEREITDKKGRLLQLSNAVVKAER
ncbi:MAG: hypothetical protein K2M72_06670 [Paramuribaculum sp.]|nr:hypothetical protein [Paramuribaculum sp.]